MGPDLADEAHPGAVRLPRAAQRPQGGARRAHHRRARQGALRRPRRGHPRARGRRVRLRHPASAQGRLLRERVDQGRRVLDPPAARRRRRSSARSTSRPWCRCGSSRSRSRAATPWSSSRARRTRRPQLPWPSSGRRPGCPTVSSTSCTATRRRSTRCSTHPDVVRRSPSSARPRSRATSTRPAPRTASGCRRWAARRTTWSCCPTPTSTSPPTPPSTPASARRASAAWRSPRSSPSTRSATSWSPRSRDRMAGLQHRRRPPRQRHGPARHPGRTATRSRRTSTPASPAGATLVVDGRGTPIDGDAERVLARADAASTT